jgi:hypothetical protein
MGGPRDSGFVSLVLRCNFGLGLRGRRDIENIREFRNPEILYLEATRFPADFRPNYITICGILIPLARSGFVRRPESFPGERG